MAGYIQCWVPAGSEDERAFVVVWNIEPLPLKCCVLMGDIEQEGRERQIQGGTERQMKPQL